ncbi:zygote arrest protein 1-like [Mercenaria mercenaria]|uniref:zygote arrest protein 1-like n=1 Tax=Mercenaria mercenaria TaxID=6596 RepID=UPI00234F18B5|nr:zygote arrest protein 1-like [Mercenaria mercenaria]
MEREPERRENRRRRPRLERKFGLFHCPCSKESSWASAHVYCVEGTYRVYFKQKCKICNTPRNPYKVRDLQCPDCGLDRDDCECECIYCNKHRYDCICEFEEEKGPEKPHRSDLCMKCIAGIPCSRDIQDEERTVRKGRRRRRRRRN